MLLGQASTTAEKDIESAIRQIPEWQGRPVEYHRINAGMTNLNWKINLKDTNSTYFMKVPGAMTNLFIDRRIAYEAAVLAAEAGCGPGMMYYLPELDIEVHEFLEGYTSCNVADVMNREIREGIAKAYQQIHSKKLSKNLCGFSQFDSRLQIARQYGVLLPDDFEFILWQVNRARKAIEASGMNLVACFNDSHISNYMKNSNNGIKLIDWEYAYNNDPYWDLAMFSTEAFYKKHQINELVEIHDGKFTSEATARIHLYSAVMLVTWYFWAMIQEEISAIGVDFHKYASLLLMKARSIMHNPEWELSLATV